MHAVQNLDAADSQTLLSGLLEEIIEAANQFLPGVPLEETILEHGQGAMIRCGLVDG